MVKDQITAIPAEQFLNTAKTTFVNKFAWTAEAYPGSTNPSLENEPVLVLALEGNSYDAKTGALDTSKTTTTYSFIALKNLVDIYTAGDDTKTVSVSVDSTTNKITATVKVSAAANNAITVKDDGLHVDITGKTDKLTGENILANQVLIDNGTGNIAASKVTIGGATVTGTETEGVTTYSDKVLATEAAVMAQVGAIADVLVYATQTDIDNMFPTTTPEPAGE